jgi:LysR family transcriptional regulator, glycine cleavage system transcriptional activator
LNRNSPLVGLPTLTWLRAFEAAARTSSFTAAAAELRITSGAISYQIRALEAHLGFALFERLPRGVRLTPLGVAYLPPVRRAFEQLADSTVGIFGGGGEHREIAIHAPVSLASLWLAPKLPAFMAAFPGIEVRLSSVIWDNPAPDEATDLEIRYGGGQWRGYRSELLMTERIVAVCSPSLLARMNGASAADWLPQNLIHIKGYEDHWLTVRQALQLGDGPERRGPIVDTTLAALELAAAGAGCVLAHRVFLDPYLATGRLAYAVEQDFPDGSSYFLVAPERPQRVRREVQQFRDWLKAAAIPSHAAPS